MERVPIRAMDELLEGGNDMTISGSARVIGLLVAATALTAPAVATAAPGKPAPKSPVIRNCLSEPTVKPKTIDLSCADANSRIVGITWDEAWGPEMATGIGTIEENTCKPDCARGKQTARKVTINVHTPVGKGADRRFTKVTYGSSGSWGNNFKDAELPR
ncbi:hypothetical protein GCM10009551_082120 [Nocardiopsis tropica]